LKNQAIYEVMWKQNCTTGWATDDNMAYEHWMLDTSGYKHILNMCNTYLIEAIPMWL